MPPEGGVVPRRRYADSGRALGLHQDAEQVGQLVAHLATVDDQVDRAVVDQELRTLESFRQRLAHGLLDHTRAGEADQCLRLADVDVAQHRQACGDATGGRVGQHADVRRSEEPPSELQSLIRISYAVFCLKKNKTTPHRMTLYTNN